MESIQQNQDNHKIEQELISTSEFFKNIDPENRPGLPKLINKPTRQSYINKVNITLSRYLKR